MALTFLLVLHVSAHHVVTAYRCCHPLHDESQAAHAAPTSFHLANNSASYEWQHSQSPIAVLSRFLLTSVEARALRNFPHLSSRERVLKRHISDPRRRRFLHGAALVASTAPIILNRPALAAIELSDEEQLIVDAWAVIQRAYVDPSFNGIDWKALRSEYAKRRYRSMKEARVAASEMIGRLGDKYTRYVNPKEYEYLLARFEAGEKERLGDIGVTLARKDGNVIEVTGTKRASDLHAGDVVLSMDGKDLRNGVGIDDLYSILLGPVGSNVEIEYRRPDETGARKTILQRVPVGAGDIKSQIFSSSSGSVGVVTIPDFEEGSRWFSSFENSLKDVRDADRLVLDLRGNLGGHFPTGVEAARLFLPKDRVIVFTQNRLGQRTSFDTIVDGSWANLGKPFELIVDSRTASAAEVFAAALQDNGIAKLRGEPTFGKGLVQTIAKVSDGGAIVCTTAKYITPKGNDINRVGIVPDIVSDCPTTRQAIECV